jgi:hypothetical protein
MTPLQRALRGLAHAEGQRVRAAVARLGFQLMDHAEGATGRWEREVLSGTVYVPVGIPDHERVPALGRALARRVEAVAAPLVDTLVQACLGVHAQERARLAALGMAADVVASRDGASLARALAAAPPLDAPPIRAGLASDLGLDRALAQLRDGAGLDPVERLHVALAANWPSPQELRDRLGRRATCVAAPLLDVVDDWLETGERA